MLKKFAVSTAVIAATGMGLASPAYAQEEPKKPEEVNCVIKDTGNTLNRQEAGLAAILSNLGLYDILSNRDVYINCQVTQQINNNQHKDSHESASKPGYRVRGRR